MLASVNLDEEVLKRVVADVLRDSMKELTPGATWRERIWTAPSETRLGVSEVAEAVGRSKACVYRWTRNKTIPVRRLDGELVFKAADVRQFIKDREEAA